MYGDECKGCPFGKVVYDEYGSDFECSKENCHRRLKAEPIEKEFDIDDSSIPF